MLLIVEIMKSCSLLLLHFGMILIICNGLLHNNEDNFKITLKLFEKLQSQQIEGVKLEDIPNKIAELLYKTLKKKIEVKGDGIKTDINIKIENL